MPTLLKDVEKKDDEARTFAPPHKRETKKIISDFEELQEISKNRNINELLKDNDEYINTNLSNANNLIDEMKKNKKKRNNILDIGNNNRVNFNDIINFLQDIVDGKINNFNRKEKYNEKSKNIEKKIRK